MKTKKLLLALPMVTLLASCSGKIEVYRDIFKDARGLSEEIKTGLVDKLAAYQYTGTRTIVTTLDGEEVGRKVSSVSVEFYHRVEAGDYSAEYRLDDEVKMAAENKDDPLYSKFQQVVFSWNGHVLSGNFDVLGYEYNTKLLNCVSARFSKKQVENQNVKDGDFTFIMSGDASYSDGEIKHVVKSFSITYESHRLKSYSCVYSLIAEGESVVIDKSYSGEFIYN